MGELLEMYIGYGLVKDTINCKKKHCYYLESPQQGAIV